MGRLLAHRTVGGGEGGFARRDYSRDCRELRAVQEIYSLVPSIGIYAICEESGTSAERKRIRGAHDGMGDGIQTVSAGIV